MNELCTETWTVGDGVVIAAAIEGKGKKQTVAERRAQKLGLDASELEAGPYLLLYFNISSA